jgi:hypothetical protein
VILNVIEHRQNLLDFNYNDGLKILYLLLPMDVKARPFIAVTVVWLMEGET